MKVFICFNKILIDDKETRDGKQNDNDRFKTRYRTGVANDIYISCDKESVVVNIRYAF